MSILFWHNVCLIGPEGCPADVVTGQPKTFGLETEVLQSLVQYLCALPEPLISTDLYGLHMAVNSEYHTVCNVKVNFEGGTSNPLAWLVWHQLIKLRVCSTYDVHCSCFVPAVLFIVPVNFNRNFYYLPLK